MAKLLSAGMISKEAKLPETTIRRYLTTFEDFFASKQIGRAIKYDVSSVGLIKKINTLYSDGYSTKNIHEMLSEEETYSPSVVEDDVAGGGGSELAAIPSMKQMAAVVESLLEQKTKPLLDKIEELEQSRSEHKMAIEELHQHINERDAIIEAMQNQLNRKPWWKRIF